MGMPPPCRGEMGGIGVDTNQRRRPTIPQGQSGSNKKPRANRATNSNHLQMPRLQLATQYLFTRSLARSSRATIPTGLSTGTARRKPSNQAAIAELQNASQAERAWKAQIFGSAIRERQTARPQNSASVTYISRAASAPSHYLPPPPPPPRLPEVASSRQCNMSFGCALASSTGGLGDWRVWFAKGLWRCPLRLQSVWSPRVLLVIASGSRSPAVVRREDTRWMALRLHRFFFSSMGGGCVKWWF
jgi:hypothetical protein